MPRRIITTTNLRVCRPKKTRGRTVDGLFCCATAAKLLHHTPVWMYSPSMHARIFENHYSCCCCLLLLLLLPQKKGRHQTANTGRDAPIHHAAASMSLLHATHRHTWTSQKQGGEAAVVPTLQQQRGAWRKKFGKRRLGCVVLQKLNLSTTDVGWIARTTRTNALLHLKIIKTHTATPCHTLRLSTHTTFL